MSYVKFIILGEERTGSNYLQLLLYSHPNVRCLGELFNPNEEVRKKNARLKPIAAGGDPVEFLETNFYVDYPDSIKALGFRLFYSHARREPWLKVWSYLRDIQVKIIDLRRKNLLDRYLSHQLAMRSQTWIDLGNSDRELYNKPIRLDFQDCLKKFQISQWFYNKLPEFFDNNEKAIIFYEDLLRYSKGENERMQDFLGLPKYPLESSTRKQRIKNKTEIIENYAELRQKFEQAVANNKAKPEWLEFFTD